MKAFDKSLEKYTVKPKGYPPPMGNNRALLIPKNGNKYFFVISDGLEWDHVSVSIADKKRCPTWEEMTWAKNLFFDKDETVIQIHPAEKNYVNNHPYCLHLWRYQGGMPTPPVAFV